MKLIIVLTLAFIVISVPPLSHLEHFQFLPSQTLQTVSQKKNEKRTSQIRTGKFLLKPFMSSYKLQYHAKQIEHNL